MKLGTIESKVKVDGLAQFGDDLKKADATMDAFAQQTSRRMTRVETDIKAVAKSVGMSAQDMQLQIDRAMKSVSADTATKSLERMAKQMGLSKQEVVALGQQMGLSAGTINNLTSKLYGLNTSAKSTETAMSGLKTAALAVSAAFATYKVADFIKDSAMLAARYETLGVVMDTVGANAGYTSKEMNSTADALQKTGISMVESRQQATKLVQAHMDLSKATDLARVAQNAAVIAGENSSATFARLVDAIQTAQPEMLRTVGINVNFEASYKKLASQLGVTADSLSENEKMQARFNAVMEKAPDIAGVYERAMGTAGKAISSFSRYVDDFEVKMGTAFGPALQQFVNEATISMKGFQDEISRPEAQQSLASLASGAAQLGANLMRGAVPALNAAVTAINDLVSAWGKIPAPLQGLILGGGIAGIATKFNPMAMLAGAAGGAAYVAESTKDLDQKIKEAQKVYDDLNSQKGGIGGFITSAINGDQYLDDLIKKQKQKLDELVGKRESLRSQAEIRMPVSLVGPDGNPLEQGVKKKIEEVAYSATDSDNLLKGNGTAQYQLGEAWQKNLGIIQQLQRKIDSGKLSQEDMTRAINDQKEAWGRIGDAQESFIKKADRGGKSAPNAAARYGEQTAGYLKQAQDQYDQLVAQLGGDRLGAKLASIDKKYDALETSIRKGMIGAKGATEDAQAALAKFAEAREMEKLIAQADAWKKSMQDAASMLGELGRLSGDPSAIYGATMTTAKAWEAEQKKRIDALDDEAEKAKQTSELQQIMALKELDARAQAYEGMKSVSSKYWESERELLEQRLSIAKANADDELAYRIYAAQQWDEYNKKKVEQQATTGRSFSDVFAAKWSLHYGGYKSEMTKTQESWSSMSESIINATDGMIDGVSGGIGDMIRNIGNGTASIEDLWKNMLARMLDAFASFIEEAIKQWLKDMVGGMFSGASSSQPTVQGMAGGGNYGGGALWGGLAAALGKTSGSGSDAATSASKSLTEAYLFSGELNPTGQQLATATGGVSAAMGLMSMVASWLPVAGAVIGIGGSLLGMLLGNDKKKKEPTKLYDGTQTIVSNGVAGSLQYEVMSDGSLKAKVMDPQDITESQKAFKELTKSVKDAAKALNIDLVADFDKTFTLITGVVTDELKDTAQWVMQSAYGQSALGDLSGAVQFFSSGMENMVEIFTGLAESIQNVKGRIEALGIDFTKFSGITDALLSQVAEFATDEYVSMKSVAKSSGSVESVVEAMTTAATSVDDLAQAATDAAEYLAKYKDEITSLAEAAVSQLYEDALGGKDSYTSAMDTYAKYGITTKAEKQSALDYYTGKLSDLLGDFTSDFSKVLVNFDQTGISAKNVSSFWSAYNAAMQQTMSPKMLAAWAEMASYAALVEDTSKALEKAKHDSQKLSSDLQYRQKVAAGLEKEAAITKLLADYENELFEARQNDYTYSEQALLVETQVIELQAKLNDLLGETADATSSYDEALKQFTDAVSNQAKALSNIASTASGLESTYSSAADSLEGLLDTVLEELTTGAGFFLDARLQDFDALYKKAVSGDSESMSKLSESASKVWESIKAGGVSPEEYDTAYWTLVNKTATAQELAKSKEDYNKIIADLSQQQVDILNSIKDELASDSPDDSIISLGNSLEQILNNFQAAYDDHITGMLSGDSYKGQMAATEKALTSWVALAASGATVGADQLSRIGGLGGSYLAAHAGESSVSAASLTEALGGSAFIQQLMAGNIQLSGLSEQQAALLGSAMASLETITGLTGTNLTYSDQARYYLAQVADGVAIKDWAPVIDVIQAGTQEQIAAYREAIASLTAKGEELRAQAAAEAATTAAQTAYFAGIYDLLNKQTQIELYTGLISNAQETATGYLNYAVMAMSMGSAVTALSWMSQYSQVQGEIETLKAYLSYWNSYTPSVRLASGGITNGPTTALIGEGGEREVVSPLSDLQNIIDVKTPTVVVDLSELKNEIRTLREELREIKYNTKDTADNTSTSNTRAARP